MISAQAFSMLFNIKPCLVDSNANSPQYRPQRFEMYLFGIRTLTLRCLIVNLSGVLCHWKLNGVFSGFLVFGEIVHV